jgi:hypothetical protein
LILLPILAIVGLVMKSVAGNPSAGSAFALLTFILLGGGIVVGALGMARGWDGEADPD